MQFTGVRTLSVARGASKNRSVAPCPDVHPTRAAPRDGRAFLSWREWFGLAPPVAAWGSRELTSSGS
jgi:hypothetical protein